MESLYRRIERLGREHGYGNMTVLCKEAGVPRSTMSELNAGRSKFLSKANAQKFANTLGISLDEIYGSKSTNIGAHESGNILRVPVLGDVAAGIPMMAIENIIDYEEVPAALAAGGELFGLRIKGASMEPRIREGDVVIVRRQDDADTGDTAVVLINGGSATVKRIKKEPGGLSLIPNNPAYDIKYFSNDDISTLPVQIIGKVVELRGKF